MQQQNLFQDYQKEQLMTISLIHSDLLQRIKLSYMEDETLQKIITALQHNSTSYPHYSLQNGVLKSFNNPCVTSDSVVEAVNVVNRSRQQISTLLQHNLSKAHNRMKFYADKKRSERHFEVGDFVYLKLQPYRQSSVANTPFHKLVARYYGPYEILEKVGAVAYKLALPTRSKIHNVFHVSLLKKHKGDRPTSITLSPFQDDGSLPLVLFAIISRRMHKRNNRVVTQVLVQWLHTRPEDAVWMDLDGFV
ncbi:hypothetical protein L6164_001252 [Bauhinia variegata]|uniref:Uncharacterized protein n=1 Tax=Bauhinia variegata TaxID=167791 RepID=A0ACB9Q8Z2_BAUVA|nr:hypothetical protein L6164_001252 [Bauhinia variegata]